MRSILIFIFIVVSSFIQAATYYIATNGSDSNPGSISSPFATWQKGFNVAQPGDIVYIRGGTYYPQGTSGHDVYSGVYIQSKNGIEGKMINVWAYPGETPVLDCKNMTNAATHIGIYLDNSDYWYLKGLTIKNCIQIPGYGGHGLWLRAGNYCRFEQLDISFIGGSGLCVLYESEKNYIYNCDVHDCFDQYTKKEDGSPDPGQHADGIDLADITERPGNERVNTFRGVRAWNNADDGFDHYRCDGVLIIDSCWVWHNGYNYGGNTPTGNGNGFKLGLSNGTPETYAQRTLTNCISYDNRQRGYSQEAANVNMIFYNNIAYKNQLQGFGFTDYDRPDILRNNISYANSSAGAFQPKQIHDHNSWDSGVTLSDADFASLDGSQLSRPRKANGCLPDITFLAPAAGSDLVDKGVNVGLTFAGKAPDLGPFEKSFNSAPLLLSFISGVVENATPSVLNLTYSAPLSSILPSLSSFYVTVNSVDVLISSLSISGSNVLLNLAVPIANGNIVTVAYTKPATNILQSSTGALASTMSAVNVKNNVTESHVFLGSIMQNPNVIQLNYNDELLPAIPSFSSFNVIKDAIHVNVNSIQISGSSVFLTLDAPVAEGEQVIIDYIVPAINPIEFLDATKAEGLENIEVVNNLHSIIPEYLSASIESATSDLLYVTFDSELSSRIPQTKSFEVKINGSSQPVKKVGVKKNKLTLTLQAPVFKDDIVLVSYRKPAENSLQAVTGGTVNSFSDQLVTNNATEKGSITIYPNPATDYINISNLDPTTENMVVRIFNLAGKVCLENYLDSFSTNRIQFNLKSGIYVVQVVMGSVVKNVQKLIIR